MPLDDRIPLDRPRAGGGPGPDLRAPPDGLHASSYVSRIDGLTKSYPMVYFVPEAPEIYREGQGFWQVVIEHQQEKLSLPLTNVVLRASQSFHEALDA